MKFHLPKLPRHDVGLCSAITPEIMRIVHDSIHSNDRKMEEAVVNRVKLTAGEMARSSRIYSYPTEGRG